MGCATSMCSCTQTSVSTVNPGARTHVRLNGHSRTRRRSGLSRPAVVSVDTKSSHWSSYDLDVKAAGGQFSDVHHTHGPCEIDSDDDGDDRPFTDRQRHHAAGMQDPRGLLTEQSKWTVTVRLYAQKAADQRSTDIPSVEETGSHYSSGEHRGKSGSSERSMQSGKVRILHAQANGMVPKEYARHRSDNRHKPNHLHHSYSEKPFTHNEGEEYSRHAQNHSAANPTYAWGQDRKSRKGNAHGPNAPLSNGSVPFNGLSLSGRHQQKYEQTSSFSTYLSFGTNHYKQRRPSINGSNRRQREECEESWQGLCETRPSRGREDQYRGFDPVCDPDDSFFGDSPADSLLTDYLGDADIVEDFSGSTHSLTKAGKRTSVSTSGKGTSVSTSGKGTSVYKTSPDSDIVIDSLIPVFDKMNRPKAALRRHRSEPFHFL